MNSTSDSDALSKEELEELLTELPNILHDLEQLKQSEGPEKVARE